MSNSLNKQFKKYKIGHFSTWQKIPKGFPYVCMADWKKSINLNKKEMKSV